MAEEEPFLRRWSRRKAKARRGAPPQRQRERDEEEESKGEREGERGERQEERQEGASAPAATAAGPAVDFGDVDFEALDFDADYTRFLAPGVPETIRNRALRRLWQSHPIFTAADPFQDYQGDYTDAAVAVPAGMLKTAYRIGRGYLGGDAAPAQIAAGTPQDRAGLQALLAAHARDPASAGCPAEAIAGLPESCRLLVARVGEAVVGGGALFPCGEAGAEIGVLFVAPGARGAGVGTRLLGGLEEEARALGARVLGVRLPAEARAAALFRRQGFSDRGGAASGLLEKVLLR
jgi:GNAT superfamily N-acetyltransferase